jgi:RNA 2',3'-cyclic 3'-phosphodiesterase
MSQKIRTFIAFDTPPEFKIAAERIQHELAVPGAPVRWESTYKLHLTMKFLGDTDAGTIEKLSATLTEIASAQRPFRISYKGLGCFPNSRNPRVIWIGCIPLSSGLEHLHDTIEERCAAYGFEKENRNFHPHITIGRVKIRSGKDRRPIPDLIKKMESITFDSIDDEVHTLLLMKSELRPGGSVYSILRQFSLSS